MTGRDEGKGVESVEAEEPRVPTVGRTVVIVLSQIVVIVALVVLWSVLRGRRSGD
jgi:hypothetical protein